MSGAAGSALPPLTVDGEAVAPGYLALLVSRTALALAAAGAGPGRGAALACDHPLTAAASAVAAELVGAPLLLDGAASVRRIAAAAVITCGAGGEPVVGPGPGPASGRAATALPEETAAVFWTSGSSGDPKAVALSRSALRHQGEATGRRMGVTPRDGLVLPLPLRHAYGFSVLQVWRATGAHLFAESGFHLRRVLSLLRGTAATSLDGVPSMYRMLATEAVKDREVARRLGALRIRGCGGDVLTEALYDEFLSLTGGALHDGYGLSEAGPNVALNAPGDVRRGTVGRLLDGVRVRLAGPAGEIQVSSPSLMLGYLGVESGTLSRDAFTRDGWLRTGDTGRLTDDGWLTVSGRIKEVLVVHGETVAPTVVEDAVRSAAGVQDAAVVGIRGGDRGDVVWAFVESADGDRRGVAGRVIEVCRRSLPPQIRPRTVRVLTALPRTGSGKHDRVRLRAWAAGEAA
ncbi:hypothetical protein AMK16_30890 [Streptomyces sp. CB00455]|uniref:class I adenylate-forming enzyme family protein n=1 Tax=Streptomyces sp. CB00455 TaxID=1703927 RepID=UPI00093D440E|nr:fatty acid--CoA ligase family protein [Streptomyces sp. CB00455]OKK14257.1 hypothetical protein AMK16_30890 [Streptomyces sp. CB00455]